MDWEETKKALDAIEKELHDPIPPAVRHYVETIKLLRMTQEDFEVYVDHFLKPLEPERYNLKDQRYGPSSRYQRGNGRV